MTRSSPRRGRRRAAGAQVIDSAGATLLPGLIDCHTQSPPTRRFLREPVPPQRHRPRGADAYLCEAHARAGFTTITRRRSPTSTSTLRCATPSTAARSRARHAGGDAGARSTGGHNDLSALAIPAFDTSRAWRRRDAIRSSCATGSECADVIKMMATAGVFSEETRSAPGIHAGRNKRAGDSAPVEQARRGARAWHRGHQDGGEGRVSRSSTAA